MAGIYEKDQAGKLQEIADEIFNIRADETPFTSMVPKGRRPKNKLATWQVEDYTDSDIEGVMDGADATSPDHEDRELLTGVAQKFRKEWGVSDFADETEVAGLAAGEKGRQKMVAAKKLKFALEGRCLSAEECSLDNGSDTPNETRGAFLWLDHAEQSVYPVPAAFRPGTSSEYTGALASLTETLFTNMLKAAFKEKNGSLNLDGFVGIDLQQVIDNWTARDPEASASSYPVRTFNQDASSKQIIKAVTSLTFSCGKVRLHPSTFLRKTSAGVASAYTHQSGIFVDLSMWRLAFMRAPRMAELPNLGGGPKGYSDCIAVLQCLNPRGQCKVETAT